MLNLRICEIIVLFFYISGYDAASLYSDLPPRNETARLARYIIHKADWVSIGSISIHDPIKGYSFVNILSMSDGPVSNSSGVPYMYMTDLDLTAEDLDKDNRCSIMVSLAQTSYCKDNGYDVEAHLCARVLISGTLEKITDKESSEYNFAKEALFSRHPGMSRWPESHGFHFTKINISHILVMGDYGPFISLGLGEYFHPQ